MVSERVTVHDFRGDPMFPRIERAVAAILANGKVDVGRAVVERLTGGGHGATCRALDGGKIRRRRVGRASDAARRAVLTEDQKKALSAKDRKAEAHVKAKKAAAAPTKRFAASKAAPFSKGGNKHDALNGAL